MSEEWQQSTSKEEKRRLQEQGSLKANGYENPMLNPLIRKKAIKSTLEHFGVESAFSVKEIRQRIEEHRLQSKGVRYANMLTKGQMIQRLRDAYNIELLEDIESFSITRDIKARCTTCGREFLFKFNKTIPTMCPYCNTNSTLLERKIVKFIETKGFKTIPHYRILEGKEIDIYVPELNIGFEINGAYSHNSGFSPFGDRVKPSDYHKKKTELALSKGIYLYHIWEHWHKDIIFSVIAAKLRNFSRTLQARKLEVNFTEKSDTLLKFMEENHVQGYSQSTVSVYLKNGSEIVQAIQYIIAGETATLVRNATILNTQVLGGLNKLFKHSLQILESKGVKEIVTYANRDLTPSEDLSVYKRLGFSFEGDAGRTLSYYVSHSIQLKGETIYKKGVYNRQNFMKSKLRNLNGSIAGSTIFNLDETLTEQENLSKLFVYPVYNSGCFRFKYTIK